MKRVDKLKEWFNEKFMKPEEGKEGKNRRLTQDPDTGKINWSEGELPLGEGPDEEPKVKEFGFEDDKKKGTRLFRPVPSNHEPYRNNRFEIEFPGIPPYFFNSYSYMGTDIHSKKRLFSSNKIIKDDYSIFKVNLLFPHEVDICEKLISLEGKPNVGDVKIHLLDPTGVRMRTILIPDCQVTEIKAFRELEYGKAGDKKDEILYGEIIVKHKQRKLF